MNVITVDPVTRATLAGINQLTEIRDDQGNVVGFFAPPSRVEELRYLQAAAQFDPQEKDRRKNSPDARLTTKEVLEYLNTLETP